MMNEAIKNEIKKAKAYRNGMLEGGEGYNPHEVKAEAMFNEMMAAEKARENEEWTLETTKTRRLEWATWVKAQTGKITAQKITERVKAQGWKPEALQAAIKRYGI